MSVKQIMEGVVRYVPTHKDHECVAADLDTGLVAHAAWVRLPCTHVHPCNASRPGALLI